jgi:arsenate reductase (thioredoxin)
MSDPIRVLFVCTHNSARSQLAEALLDHAGGGAFEAHSAGTEATRVNPFAIEVLRERGIDWSEATSKTFERFLPQRWDYVVTVCDSANQACPVFPGAGARLHWSLEDPSRKGATDEERLAAFRATADEIEERLRAFIAETAEKP